MVVHKIREVTGICYNHAPSCIDDVTLCGMALEGETDEFDSAIDITGKITCKTCIRIIEHCKKIVLN